VIVGGSRGIGLVIAQRFAARGDEVVISSRDAATADAVARTLGAAARGIPLQLADPASIAMRRRWTLQALTLLFAAAAVGKLLGATHQGGGKPFAEVGVLLLFSDALSAPQMPAASASPSWAHQRYGQPSAGPQLEAGGGSSMGRPKSWVQVAGVLATPGTG